jgi:RNA-binding protein
MQIIDLAGNLMDQLGGKQKRKLKSLAHHLKPVVLIGKNGISSSLMASLEDALQAHELIKIKFIDFKDEKRDLLKEIAAQTGAEVISLIGNIATVFRQHADETKRKIEL